MHIEAPRVVVGVANVITTNNRGLNADEWAELALNRILSISDNAPMPIREQALAFREDLKAVLVYYFKKSARAERMTISNALKSEGLSHLADKIVDIE